MVQYQRYYQWKKGGDVEDEESHPLGLMFGNPAHSKRSRPKLFYLLLISFVSCSLIMAPQLLTYPSTFSLLYKGYVSGLDANSSPCSSVPNGTICCDRSSVRSDICIMKGDVRTDSLSSSLSLYTDADDEERHEKIKPYTRKWEPNTMKTIDELTLISRTAPLPPAENPHSCDVRHDVPAIFFSTGGYTGNLYHEFNDGILPLYITSRRFNRKVVFVILEYHDWWISKYSDILSLLSDYPPIDFRREKKTLCFPEAIVGLKIHDELTVDPNLMDGSKTIKDFRELLDRAYFPRIKGLIKEEEQKAQISLGPSPARIPTLTPGLDKPKLVILARNGSRAILNEDLLVKMGQKIGFSVEVVRPERTTELAKIYRALNSSDVMVGVHGAAMTHFLFLRPESVFIQVVPLGTTWAAETYYGEPAKKLGLSYIGYEILPRESSLYDEYEKTDPVLMDPTSVNDKGWEYTKSIYLDRQNVRLNLKRFRKRLVRAYYYTIAKKNHSQNARVV